MYHIKSDRRSQASAEEITRGLQECLKTTPLKNITVSDIHRITGISRATFYRLFDTPEDVLIYQLDQMTVASAQTYSDQHQLSAVQMLEKTMELGLQNHAFIKALVENGRHDLLFSYTEKSFRELNDLKKIFPENMKKEEQEFIVANLSMSMVASQIIWSRNGRQETAKDMLCYLKQFIRVMESLLEG